MNFAPFSFWACDNLPVLRQIDTGCVPMIYFDPPFNSNRHYASPLNLRRSFSDIWPTDDGWKNDHAALRLTCPRAHAFISSLYNADDDRDWVHPSAGFLTMMAPRIMEALRILAPTGNLLLHCDDREKSHLDILVKQIAGRSIKSSEIIWQRSTSGQNKTASTRRDADTILRYHLDGAVYNVEHQAPDREYVAKHYTRDDDDGRGPYRLVIQTKPGGRGPGYLYDFEGVPAFQTLGWRCPERTMRRYFETGQLHLTETRIYRKQYLRGWDGFKPYSGYKGAPLGTVWADIPPRSKREYETQKPVDLLRRLIRVYSNPGDLVLDPFAGGGTTIDAAMREGRLWAACDKATEAIGLIRGKLDEMALWTHEIPLNPKAPLPVRGDLPAEVVNYTDAYQRKVRRELEARHGLKCPLCRQTFADQGAFDLDHINPKAKGGTNEIGNLQLLCTQCNRDKGTKTMMGTMAYLRDHPRKDKRRRYAKIVEAREAEGLEWV